MVPSVNPWHWDALQTGERGLTRGALCLGLQVIDHQEEEQITGRKETAISLQPRPANYKMCRMETQRPPAGAPEAPRHYGAKPVITAEPQSLLLLLQYICLETHCLSDGALCGDVM